MVFTRTVSIDLCNKSVLCSRTCLSGSYSVNQFVRKRLDSPKDFIKLTVLVWLLKLCSNYGCARSVSFMICVQSCKIYIQSQLVYIQFHLTCLYSGSCCLYSISTYVPRFHAYFSTVVSPVLDFGIEKLFSQASPSHSFPLLYHDFYRLLNATSEDHSVPGMLFVL